MKREHCTSSDVLIQLRWNIKVKIFCLVKNVYVEQLIAISKTVELTLHKEMLHFDKCLLC